MGQSLNVIAEGADGIASFKMGAFVEEDWRLQKRLCDEYGWRLRLADRVLSVTGPPFGEMRLPRWDARECRIGECAATVQRSERHTLVRAGRAWVRVDLTPQECAAGAVVSVPVECHNGTKRGVRFELSAKLPDGWKMLEPLQPIEIGPESEIHAACKVKAPDELRPGDYWIEIDAADADTGRFVPRAKPPVHVELDGTPCTVVPVSRTHFTAAPTWVPIRVGPA